jgi:hypothetical protein
VIEWAILLPVSHEVSGPKESRGELTELLRAIERLREACLRASGTQPRPPRELLTELTRRDVQARQYISGTTYAALPSSPPGPDMSCGQFWLRCMDLLEALREYKRERVQRDADAH